MHAERISLPRIVYVVHIVPVIDQCQPLYIFSDWFRSKVNEAETDPGTAWLTKSVQAKGGRIWKRKNGQADHYEARENDSWADPSVLDPA